MLRNHINSDVVQKMNDISKYEFYLTGSTFFRGRGNDIDFFVQAEDGLIPFLLGLGFEMLQPIEHNYQDSHCISVLRHKGISPNIDVQIVKNAILKNRIQQMFLKCGIFKPTDSMWDLAYALSVPESL